MNHRLALAAVTLALATPVFAAPPKFNIQDFSTATLIDKPAVMAVWNEALSKKLSKVYAPSKWGFLSQVEGGFNGAKVCVVTARVTMLPVSGKKLVFTPEKTSTTFDALPNLNQAQCTELATEKLKEAVQSLMSGLVKT